MKPDFSGLHICYENGVEHAHQFICLAGHDVEVRNEFLKLIQAGKVTKGDKVEIFKHVHLNGVSYQRCVAVGEYQGNNVVKY